MHGMIASCAGLTFGESNLIPIFVTAVWPAVRRKYRVRTPMPCHAMRHISYARTMPSVSLLLPLERVLLDTTIASSRVRAA